MKKRCLLSLLLLCLLFSACTAAEGQVSCRTLVEALTKAEVGLPAGRLYAADAEKGEDAYLSPALSQALFGSQNAYKLSGDWLDCALYLSLTESPCQFAAVLCKDPAVAADTARLFSARLLLLKQTKTDPAYTALLEKATVLCRGNYVFLLVSSDPENAKQVIKKLL